MALLVQEKTVHVCARRKLASRTDPSTGDAAHAASCDLAYIFVILIRLYDHLNSR